MNGMSGKQMQRQYDEMDVKMEKDNQEYKDRLDPIVMKAGQDMLNAIEKFYEQKNYNGGITEFRQV